ncbi:MAG: exodeoxyribonuclease V subunit gamma, partial [Thermoleophilaceae bacterium]|nr:exodeoxyribonuclease V subunit gamma [Thermoleophilaceae bacterium]
MSPYRARARRFDHVFVLSLQEGDFPRRGRDDPLLTDEERAAAGLPERADARDEERYLFYVCLSRAKKRLWLSWRATDDEGKETARSFFVDDVLELLDGAPREQRRDLADTVFAPGKAPTNDELARSLAVRHAVGGAAGLELSARLDRAMRRAEFLPGDLVVPRVRAELGARKAFGASSLEKYADCPFIYLAEHELTPRPFDPESDALAKGGKLHTALEETYREFGRPTPENLDAVQERARAILLGVLEGSALAPEGPEQRAVHRRMESDLMRFLAWDAEHPLGLEPWRLEAQFGEREGSEKPSLDLGGVTLHGAIDRIDVAGGKAFIRDYKSGANVLGREKLASEQRLQLQLYMLAVRELWELEPVGAVYHPLGQNETHEPRGILRGPKDGDLPAGPFKGKDFTETPEQFDEALEHAREEAVAIAERIRAGELAREPRGGSCSPWCGLFGICRIERGNKDPDRKPAAGASESDA